MRKTHMTVAVTGSLAELMKSKQVRESVLYYEGDWWYQTEGMAQLVNRSELSQEISIRTRCVEYLPAIGFSDHWMPRGDRLLTPDEAIYAVTVLAMTGPHLLSEGERLLAYDAMRHEAWVVWRLSGKYLVNGYVPEAHVDGAYVLATGR